MNYHIPNFKSLQAFEAVAKEMDFGKAAQAVSCTEAELEFRLHQLEKLLGYKLFIREDDDLKMTQIAKDYLPFVKQSLDILKRSTNDIRKQKNTVTVNLSTNLSFLNNWLGPQLGGFYSEYPDIDLRISSQNMQSSLWQTDIDVAVYFGKPDQWKNMDATPLMKEDLFPVIAPSFVDQEKLKEPQDVTYFTLLHSSNAKEDWQYWAQSQRLLTLDYTQGIYFRNEVELYEAVMQGKGIAIARESKVAAFLENKSLKRINFPEAKNQENQFGYYILTPRHVESMAEIRLVRNWLIDLFRSVPEIQKFSKTG